MINKNLLAEVFKTITSIHMVGQIGNIVHQQGRSIENNTVEGDINVHQLSSNCKEWARTKDYLVQTGNRLDGTTRYDVFAIHKDEDIEASECIYYNEIFDSEPSAIFEACKWILDNKDK